MNVKHEKDRVFLLYLQNKFRKIFSGHRIRKS